MASSNWLGSKASSQPNATSAISQSQNLYSPSFNGGYVASDGVLRSSLSVMPMRSDGSLCIMEALHRPHSSQVTIPSSPSKLENLTGATVAANHQYEDSMILSLGNAYHEYVSEFGLINNCNNNCNNMFLTTPYVEQTKKQENQPVESNNSEGFVRESPCLKAWINHRHHHQQEQGVEAEHYQVNNGSNLVADGTTDHAMGYVDLQSWTLSTSPGTQSSCLTALETKKMSSSDKSRQKPRVHRKSFDTFGQRTSQYRGVTRHRWTGRYEAHLWDNSCKKEGQKRKGRQIYLGGYDMEEKAARAYDLAALKYWGPSTHINFALENYLQEIEEMKHVTRQEHIAHLRRKSSGFSRGASMYRGVTRHHQQGRWQARIGRVAGNKDLYLGTFSTQEEAAEAYDVAAIKFRGLYAVTNFDISRYDVEKIIASNTLPTGEIARRNKATKHNAVESNTRLAQENANPRNLSDWKVSLRDQSSKNQDIDTSVP